MANGGPRNASQEAPATIRPELEELFPATGVAQGPAIRAKLVTKNVFAWFVISPVDESGETLGVQRLLTASSRRGLQLQANYILGQIGAQPTARADREFGSCGHVWRHRSMDERQRGSGLMWMLIPCTAEGVNILGADQPHIPVD